MALAQINQHKVVASLPDPLEANSIYYVRVGEGFDTYVTNSSGVIVAYEQNVYLPEAAEVEVVDAGNYFVSKDVEGVLQELGSDVGSIEASLGAKVDKVAGMGLSSNDFTDQLRDKLDGIEAGATTNQGTVTSVGLSLPTGLSVSGTPVTDEGVLAVTYSAGYSIPTNTKQGQWDSAYGWGNHANAGYLTKVTWGDVQGKPEIFPPEPHTHDSSDISGSVTVGDSTGEIHGAKIWIGQTNANSDGLWTIDYSSAGFTEVFGVFPSGIARGSALADRLIAVNGSAMPTNTTASGHLMSASAAGLLVAVTLTASAGAVRVLVIGR